LDLRAIQHSDGFLGLERSTQTLANQLLEEKQEILKALSDQTNSFGIQQDRTNQIIEAQHNQTRKEIIASIENGRLGQPLRRINHSGNVHEGAEEEDDEHPEKIHLVQRLILQSLRFRTMDDRYEEIEPAHKKTFGWIFTEPDQEKKMWADFPKWLSTGTGIYWINGKAASGKSTIMRYIFDDPRTENLLKEWSRQNRLIRVAHFFWNSGTADQRSHLGLLRGLLFKILRQCDFLTAEVFPEIWKDRISNPIFIIEDMGLVSWTLSKLSTAFDRLVCSQNHGIQFCLFVDGLDEYDGDYFDVIKIFTRISQSSNVKVCLSSRPLSDFVVSFKSCPSLRLQDLTFNDIQQYINDELGANKHMQELQRTKPVEAQSLVSEIMDKADGVFLWVKLVVLSLLRGLRHSDQICDLRMRLKLVPPSLEDLFSHILGRLDPVYLEQSSRIFQIFAEAQKIKDIQLTCLELSFAEELDTFAVMAEPTRQRSERELVERRFQVEDWLRTRCGGLIEPYSGEFACDSPSDARLSYLHRTVRDFLELPEIWGLVLKPTTGKGFVPSVVLLQSQVLYIKWVLPFWKRETKSVFDLQKFATRALSFARQAEIATGRSEVAMLDELDRVCSDLLRGLAHGPSNWTTELQIDQDSIEYRDEAAEHFNTFMALAIKSGLQFYVTEKLKLEPWILRTKEGRPLLHYAVQVNTGLCGDKALQPYPDLVKLLLSYGSQVSDPYEGVSAWEHVLESIFLLLKEISTLAKIVAKWLAIVKLFLENGANPAQCIGKDQSKLAYVLVNAISSPHPELLQQAKEIKELLISPGCLAERANQNQQAHQMSQKATPLEDASTQRPYSSQSRLNHQSPLLAESMPPITRPTAPSQVFSESRKREEIVQEPQTTKSTRSLVAQSPEPSRPRKDQHVLQNPQSPVLPTGPISQSLDPRQSRQDQQTILKVPNVMVRITSPDQGLGLSQWRLSRQDPRIPVQVPPPVPPKIPILAEHTDQDRHSSPSNLSHQASQSIPNPTYPIRPTAQPTEPLPWRESQQDIRPPQDLSLPTDFNARRPRSSQGIPLPAGSSPPQFNLSHHRSYNSLLYAQNGPGQANYPEQPPVFLQPYDNSLPQQFGIQRPSHPPPPDTDNYSLQNNRSSPTTSFLAQYPVSQISYPTPQPRPQRQANYTPFPASQPTSPQPPYQISPYPYVAPQSNPHHYQHQQNTCPLYWNPHSQSYQHQIGPQHMQYTPPYISPQPKYPTPPQNPHPPDPSLSPASFEQVARPEPEPGSSSRPRNWMERLKKPFRT